MIDDFHFLRPWWLVALLLPVALLWLSSLATDARSRWKGMIAPHLLDSLIVQPKTVSRVRPSWLLATVLLLTVTAAAGPAWQREPPPFVEDTAPLVIAVDLSSTMDAQDVTPSRLERAKLKIKDIVARRDGGRTAIVAYAGSAHQVLPLTNDTSLLDTYADALATRIMPTPGKNTVAALDLARKALSDGNAAGTILFLTDGIEVNSIPAFGRSEVAVVILGIGKVAAGPNLPGFDIDALKKLGKDTGASVATFTDDDSDVRWVTQHVATNFAAKKADDGDSWKDAGFLLLFPTAAVFALTFRRGWVVRVGVFLLAARLLLVPSMVEAAGFADMWLTPDQQARLAYDRGDFEVAAARFRDPMWKGTALYRAGKFQDAAGVFAVMDSPEAFYNQGNALLHLAKYEEAVTAYKKALAVRQNWTEAQSNLATAQRLLAAAKKDDDEQPQDPNEKPDDIQFDDKGKKGKVGQVNIAEQTSEMWMKNIQVSPADLMARKFAIEAGERR